MTGSGGQIRRVYLYSAVVPLSSSRVILILKAVTIEDLMSYLINPQPV